MKKSEFLSLDIKDLIKGGIMAGLAVIVTGGVLLIEGILQTPPIYPTLDALKTLGLAGLGTFSIYILKNLITDKDDKFLKVI